MKKILVVLLSSLLLLTGCFNEKEKAVEEPKTEMVTDEAEIKKFVQLYEDARATYNWFDFSTLPVDMEKPLDSDEEKYAYFYEVIHPDFSTIQGFKEYVAKYFSKEVVEKIFSESTLYVEVDGVLYGTIADRGSDITKGKESYQVQKINDDQYNFVIEVEIIDPEKDGKVTGTEIITFPIQKVEDHFVFTQYENVR